MDSTIFFCQGHKILSNEKLKKLKIQWDNSYLLSLSDDGQQKLGAYLDLDLMLIIWRLYLALLKKIAFYSVPIH